MKYEITKGSEKDFECQPDAVVAIYCINGSPNYLYSSMPSSEKLHENWLTCNFEVVAERRPITEPVWDGSTPPPVGIECEVLFTSEGSVFERARILHVGDDGIVGRWLAGDSAGGLFDYMYIPHDYRPIRSPEDVARSNAIGEMERAYEELTGNPAREAEEYYDLIAAGKIKGVALESKVEDLKINITTDEMWREFEKKSDMEDVRKLMMERASRRGSF